MLLPVGKSGAHLSSFVPECTDDVSFAVSADVSSSAEWRPGFESRAYPVLFLPPLSGRAEAYFRQLTPLAALGFRALSVEAPPLWSLAAFNASLQRLLDTLGIQKVHSPSSPPSDLSE